MRKRKNRYLRLSVLLLIIQSSCISTFCAAQSTDEAYHYALNVMEEGNYDHAKKLLHRVLYFDTESRFPEVFRQLGDCYYACSEFDYAYYYYDLARVQAKSDTAAAGLQLMKAACMLNSMNYQEALVDLLSIDQLPNPSHERLKQKLSALTYFYIGDHPQAERCFLLCLDSGSSIYADSIKYYFKHIAKLEQRYNPRTARVLSIILPGAGQIYAGDFSNGLNSLLLTSGLIGAGTLMMGSISMFDAAIIVLPWFQRYYTGGFQKAYRIAEEKRAREQNDDILNIIRMLDIEDTPANHL